MIRFAALAAALSAGIAVTALAEDGPDLEDPAVIEAGREVYTEANCAHCHGEGGRGGVPLADRADLDPDYVHQTITFGRVRGNMRMPPWEGVLSDEQIWQVTAYIMSISPDSAVSR